MYNLFKATNKDANVCYESYRRVLRKLNVSFTKLGEEECEACEVFKQHLDDCRKKNQEEGNESEGEIRHLGTSETAEKSRKKGASEKRQRKSRSAGRRKRRKITDTEDDTGLEGSSSEESKNGNSAPGQQINAGDPVIGDCSVCSAQEDRLVRAKISREMYKADVKVNQNSEDAYIFSMDMQKVIMLPHMPGLKTALFTRRILMINQTIAPLGGIKSGCGQPIGYLWHEGIQGRNDEDVASAVVKFLSSELLRDCLDVMIWADNCSGQNKNWTLFSAIVHHLFNPANTLSSVTLKFFEKGHTFMSADSFHHSVEEEIRQQKKLYDFHGFVRYVSRRGTAVEMKPCDFIDYKKEKGTTNDMVLPLLANVTVLQFRKNSTKFYWKESFNDIEFKESEFLKRKTRTEFLAWKKYPGKGKAKRYFTETFSLF